MRIFPLGDSALTIELGSELSPELNARAIAAAQCLAGQISHGVVEIVPAYASVTIFYDGGSTSYSALKHEIENSGKIALAEPKAPRLIEIPLKISSETSPDLGRVAEYGGLSQDDAIEIFLLQTYRVYMLGFLPGFAYMGEVDDRIAASRLETPRTKVPQGSVGIAGKQTGIYPLESPGGWNIIGRTELKMFDPTVENPCLLKPGDEVRFVRC